MSQVKDPISMEKFRAFVEANQGVKRLTCIDAFASSVQFTKRSNGLRMNLAQKKGVKEGWLFPQKKGKTVRRYYTIEYAKQFNIPAVLELDPLRGSNVEPSEVIELLARVSWIDNLWPASDRAYINNCTF